MMKKWFALFLTICVLFCSAAVCAEEVSTQEPEDWTRFVEPFKMSALNYFGFSLPIYSNTTNIRQKSSKEIPQIEGYVSTRNARIDISYYLYQTTATTKYRNMPGSS